MATSHVPDNAPESCPGTNSEQAGKASACAGCPNQKICSTAPKGPDPDLQTIAERLQYVKNIVLVLSGKGGVGKSTVSAQLALSLASKGLEVGLLDIDICGPSMPRMLGLEGQEIHHSNSGCYLRGPRKNGLIKQFLKDVDWGKLDYLVIDAPPGTSDEHISAVQFLLPSHKAHGNLAGAVIVSTPQEVSLIDVRKEINFCKKTGVPILGVVENMSGFTVPVASLSFVDQDGHDVSSKIREALGSINAGDIRANGELLFAKDGAAEKMSHEFGVPFLGKIPMDLEMSKAAEQGVSIFDTAKASPSALSLTRIVDKIVASKPTP
eukprot:jgi/Picre1/30277/NNA_005641.t1